MDLNSETIAEKLATFYSSLKYDAIDNTVISKARFSLIDFLATLCVGYKKGDLTPVINGYVLGIGGTPESTILCVQKKVPAIHAAFSMGVMSHAVELDDGHRFGTAHPAVSVIPAVLAIAERNSKSFQDILLAIIVGYDIMLRIARAINPSHLRRGFHSTGTCGSIGAAGACASLMKLNSTDMTYAISLGGLQSAGLQEMLHEHPAVKPIQPGKSASAGVLAADLVKLGAKSPRSIFEGKHGWLKAMTDNFSLDDIISDLGFRWEIMFTYTKLYPTCRHCHPVLDLGLEARKAPGFSIDNIKVINIYTYDIAISEVGNIFYPKNFDEAMFSMPYAFARVLRDGKVTLQSYRTEQIHDENIKKIIAKIRIHPDERMNSLYPRERGARIRIDYENGGSFNKHTTMPRGEPEKPLTTEELYAKIENLLGTYYPEPFITQLWDLCVNKKTDRVSYADIVELFGKYSL
ncbi:MAG: MmgE/PrpD family protein [Deltaproteobacteria bacterium]|nr:MmgE/PrpD family protein [Deltaproteobacteria bacterium]